MRILLLVNCLLLSQFGFSQNWIDTTYDISTTYNIEYGRSVDFKGSADLLEMDISIPSNDIPPECGRPLMVIVHGGAWYGGDKSEGYAVLLREDFAKRGYVSVSVNYRQGLFNTNQHIDCILGGWKCWNMTDTSEWYRANYRAIQDVHGAIRYLVNEQETYTINPDNIFLAGESAGGFVVLGVGFIDDETEILEELISEYPNAPAPNTIYENDCIQAFGLANSIAEMELGRPPLGDIEGETNLPTQTNYRIKGVGSFYGGAFNNIFESKSTHSPVLYLFHQACDLIVPSNYNRLLAGYSTCATGFPTFCQHIVNRPFVYGSNAIASLIDNMVTNGIPTCNYRFDNSGNNYSCLEQVANPNLACHDTDDYWQRTNNMATYFAAEIAECELTSDFAVSAYKKTPTLYPNPLGDKLNLNFGEIRSTVRMTLFDIFGTVLIKEIIQNRSEYTIDVSKLKSGCYHILLEMDNRTLIYQAIKI